MLLRLISEDEAPASFWRMPEPLRSERARLYIISRCAGSDPIMSWMWAMDMSAEGKRFAEEITSAHSDEAIQEAVRREFGGRLP